MDTPWAGKLSKANHCEETAQTILERINLIMWCEDAKNFFEFQYQRYSYLICVKTVQYYPNHLRFGDLSFQFLKIMAYEKKFEN